MGLPELDPQPCMMQNANAPCPYHIVICRSFYVQRKTPHPMLNCLGQAPTTIAGSLVGWRRWWGLAATTWHVNGPCSNVELCKLCLYLPAIGGTVGLDGVEDRDALDGQRAWVCHPAERDSVAGRSFDGKDLKGDGRLTALADIELDEGVEGGCSGGLAGEEVDAV